MGFPQEIHLTPDEEAALDEAVEEAVAEAQGKHLPDDKGEQQEPQEQSDQEQEPRIPITDEYVAELEQAAKAWDDPAVQRMVREMARRRKQIQQEKGEQGE